MVRWPSRKVVKEEMRGATKPPKGKSASQGGRAGIERGLGALSEEVSSMKRGSSLDSPGGSERGSVWEGNNVPVEGGGKLGGDKHHVGVVL
jgi:hypothetical protein